MNVFKKIGKVLGAVFNPIGTIAAPLISGATSLLSGASTNNANIRRQEMANQANIQIARENNANMLEQQSRKMAFDTQMWNMQNEYNSPAAQKKRLEDAGFNPYMQDVSTGVATSSPTMDTYTPQAAQVSAGFSDPNALTPGLSMLAQIPSMMLQNNSQELINQRQKTENKYLELQIMQGLAAMQKDNKLRDLDISGKKLSNAAQSLLNDFQIDTYDNRRKMVENDMIQRTLQNSLLQKQLDFLPQEQNMAVQKFVADLSTIAVNNQMTRSQIYNLAQQSKQIQALTVGTKLDNKQKARIMDSVVDAAYWNAILTRNSSGKAYWDTQRSKNNSGYDNPYKENYWSGKNGDWSAPIHKGLMWASQLLPFNSFK